MTPATDPYARPERDAMVSDMDAHHAATAQLGDRIADLDDGRTEVAEIVGTYVTGVTAIVTVYGDGHVRFGIDLSEVADPRHAMRTEDTPDDAIDGLTTIAEAALTNGTYDLLRD